MHEKRKLKIADTIIEIYSNFPCENLTEEQLRLRVTDRFKNFFYRGRQRPHIKIKVEITDKLPAAYKAAPLFITYHFLDGKENWRLLKKRGSYIYASPIKNRQQVMLVNKTFDKVTAYLLPKNNKDKVWDIADIIYDFLQVLMINYFAQRNEGIFLHASGIKDLGGRGLLFSGKSGAGKSAMVRLWYKHSKAMILNDDRIVVRKMKGRFFMYGCPWHGDFDDYLFSRIESAPLDRLFFIHHAPQNSATRIREKDIFNLIYPLTFPTFWDKRCLENVVSLCQELIRYVPCFNMGFVNDKKVIGFIRGICKKSNTKNSASRHTR